MLWSAHVDTTCLCYPYMPRPAFPAPRVCMLHASLPPPCVPSVASRQPPCALTRALCSACQAAATPPRVAQLKLSPVTRSAASSPRGLESALMTPRGNTLRTVKNLHRRRVIDDRDVAVLKDAVVDGNDISVRDVTACVCVVRVMAVGLTPSRRVLLQGLLDLLQECTPNDRFKVDSIIMKGAAATQPSPQSRWIPVVPAAHLTLLAVGSPGSPSPTHYCSQELLPGPSLLT